MTKTPGFSETLDELQPPGLPDSDAKYLEALEERCMRAVQQLMRAATRDMLSHALRASTDLEALARAVTAGGTSTTI